MAIEIRQIPVLSDNYVYLLHDSTTGATAAIDPAVAEPVAAAVAAEGWRLSHILSTHHHNDHTGGNLELKQQTGCTIVGPKADRERIPGIDVAVGEGDRYSVGSLEATVYDTPGHTRGHIAFHFPAAKAVFCGDTLFALGCGRLFEGTAEQMWSSLGKLRALPPDTRVYCGHEYTQSNARFALSVDAANERLAARARQIDELRAAGRPTVPSTIAEEIATNPFLRADDPALAAAVGRAGAKPADVLAEIRKRKDSF